MCSLCEALSSAISPSCRSCRKEKEGVKVLGIGEMLVVSSCMGRTGSYFKNNKFADTDISAFQ